MLKGSFRTLTFAVAAGLALSAGVPSATADSSPGPSVGTALGEASQRYVIAYPTIGGGIEHATSSGEVFIPKGTKPAGGWPVLAWAHGTVGVGDNCAPSSAGRTQRDVDYLNYWLDQGYAIVATDYVGMGTPGVHPYLNSLAEAHSVVDAVGTAVASNFGLSKKWMVLGQSQGGHAGLETATVARKWRPDLDYRGAVVTGAPANLDEIFPLANPLVPDLKMPGLTTFAAYFIAGFRAASPGLNVNSYLSPLGMAVVHDAENLCIDDMMNRVQGIGVGALLQKSALPLRSAMQAYLRIPVSGYDRPVFMGQGLEDTTVPAPLSAQLAAEMTAAGQPLTYKTYATDHSGTMAASLPDSTPFVKAQFAK